MITKDQVIRMGAPIIAVAVATVIACNDVTDPGKGGQVTDPRRCISDRTSRWADNGLSMNVSAPPCPFTVRDAFTSIDYIALITAPATKITFSANGSVNSYINAEVLDWYSASRIAGAFFVYFQQHPNDPGIYRAEPRMNGRPANYTVPGNSAQMLDSLHADAEFMAVGGFSKAWKILPGNITNVSQNVLGPAHVLTGSSGSWQSQPHWDTTAYFYRWLLDGQEVAGASGATYSAIFGTQGTYRLSNIAIRADNTSDTVTRTVNVGPSLEVSIDGPSEIQPSAMCTWQAVVATGTPPYSYQWTASQMAPPSGTDYYFTASKDAGSFATSWSVKVAVTDALGAPGEHEITVYENSSAGPCAY